MIDTGSSDCTIKASAVIENGFEIFRVSSDLLGFSYSENVIKSRGIIREKVTIDHCSVENVLFRITPDEVQQHDAILLVEILSICLMSYISRSTGN